VKSIVVLRALGLGDFLTGVPALAALRARNPDDRIALATSPSLEPLARASGLVDEVLHSTELQPIACGLRPDLAVNLHGRGPESHRILLDMRPRELIAYSNADVPETDGFPVWRPGEHEVDRWCRLLHEFGIPADARRLRLPPLDGVAPPPAAVGATLIHPGAQSRHRRWPAERWAEVARGEVRAGRRVAISAGPGEEALARRVASLAGVSQSVVIAVPLLVMAAAVAAARVVACGDTGVAHLATAYGTPAVVVFGPTPPWLWGPPMWHPHIALWSGRRSDRPADEPDDGLMLIDAEEVLSALSRLEQAA
jgi:ADP-heptose:LPS heptosyltransferase